jgi:penicillin-binding protein 2
VGEWKLRDHAWFIAFAPYDDPRYAMSVLIEHGGFGADAAAPRAREIMRTALLKDPEIRTRVEKPLPMPDIPQTQSDPDVVDPPPPPDPTMPTGTPTT